MQCNAMSYHAPTRDGLGCYDLNSKKSLQPGSPAVLLKGLLERQCQIIFLCELMKLLYLSDPHHIIQFQSVWAWDGATRF